MRLTLQRLNFRSDGIFGILTDEDRSQVAVTLEHAYPAIGQGFSAKIPEGTYTCQRSLHRLHGMDTDFETFEVMNVPDHTGILFHWGNWNRDSEGCVLLGRETHLEDEGSMVTDSRDTFKLFMARASGLDTFELVVQNTVIGEK
jgi:hypothetical protein